MTTFEMFQIGGFIVVAVGAYWKIKMEMKELHSMAAMKIQSLEDKAATRDTVDLLKNDLYKIKSDVYTRDQNDLWRVQHIQESAEVTKIIMDQLAAIDHKLVRVMVTMNIKEE